MDSEAARCVQVTVLALCVCDFFLHSDCLLLQQLSFDVVCQVEEGDRICGAAGGGAAAAARDKSKNLLCGYGRMGCGKVAGVFVASLFSPL